MSYSAYLAYICITEKDNLMKLNTNTTKIAQISTLLITLGVLRGYVKKPLFFLISTKLTFRKFEKSIKLDLPKDFIEMAGFMAWLNIRLAKKIDKKRAFEIVRAAGLSSGLAVQQANFRSVEQPHAFANLVKFQQLNNREGTTRLNTMEVIEQNENRYEFRITRCLFFEFFSHLEVPELTAIMCSIDNAIFNSYLPEEVTFHRNGLQKTFVSGHKYCEFVVENNSRH